MTTIKRPTQKIGGPDPIEKIIKRTKRLATKHGVKVVLSGDRYVQSGGIKSNGYFDDEELVLAVACGDQMKHQWQATFLHESSHMDQWIEQIPEWQTKINDIDATKLLDLWMNGNIELNKKQLNAYVRAARDIELDCERRTVKKIIKNRIRLIDVPTYIQKANAYVYFYNYLKKSRKWYTIGKEPYNIEEIWAKMPINFDNDYEKLPKKFERLFDKHL